MGVYNDIKADLTCPVTGKPTRGITIQTKWQDHLSLYLRTYVVGEEMEDILSKYDNRWVRALYGCPACGQHTVPEESGLRRLVGSECCAHYVFVEMRNGRIMRVVNEKQFAGTGVTEFATYW
jgi:hypothetical protein